MPFNITDSTKKTQRPKVVFRRSGEPLVTVAEDNIVRLHRLILLPPREDPLTDWSAPATTSLKLWLASSVPRQPTFSPISMKRSPA
jgi:hypothetical protein